ncbi:MAG: Cof-type HAD-IIB family hydrolase [Sphaerochaetaceae bacterium]
MTNSKIKLICSDIDHTLLDASMGSIPQRNIDAVRKAVDSGVAFVLNSGRSYDSMKHYGDILKLPEDSYIVTLGGSLIFRGASIVDSHVIDRNIALEISLKALEMGLFVHSFCKREWCSSSIDPWFDSEKRACMTDGQLFNSTDYFKDHDPHKLLVLTDDQNLMKKFGESLASFSNDITTSFSFQNGMEINPAGISKGTAIATLCSLMGIRQGEVLSVGDFYNDIEMFKVSGYSAALGEAPDDVKKVAGTVVASCREGGLAEAIEKFVLQPSVQ